MLFKPDSWWGLGLTGNAIGEPLVPTVRSGGRTGWVTKDTRSRDCIIYFVLSLMSAPWLFSSDATRYSVNFCATPGTYDETCIQRAIDDIAKTEDHVQYEGKMGRVLVSPDTYLIRYPIVIPKGVRVALEGVHVAGVGGAQLLAAGSNTSILQINSDTAKITNLWFQGTRNVGPGNGSLIVAGSPSGTACDVYVTDCWFTQAPRAAIELVNTSGFTIAHNTFELNSFAILASVPGGQQASDHIVSNNRFYSNPRAAILVEGPEDSATSQAKYWVINGNLFDFNGTRDDFETSAIRLVSHADNVAISGNQFNHGMTDDIRIISSRSVNVSGNNSSEPGRSFVLCDNASGTAIVGNSGSDANRLDYKSPVSIISFVQQGKGLSSDNVIMGNSFVSSGSAKATFGLSVDGGTIRTAIGPNSLLDQTDQPYNLLGTSFTGLTSISVIVGSCAGLAPSNASAVGLYPLSTISDLRCTAADPSGGFPMASDGVLRNLVVAAGKSGSSLSSGVFTVYADGSVTPLICTVGRGNFCHDNQHAVPIRHGQQVRISFSTSSHETMGDIRVTLEHYSFQPTGR